MSTDYMLAYGTYPTPDDCRCAMEWVSYLAANRMASPLRDDCSIADVEPGLR
jgi:hypothetical protein